MISRTSENQPLPADTPAILAVLLGRGFATRADFLAAKRRIDKARVLRVSCEECAVAAVEPEFRNGYSGLDEGRALGHFFASPASGNRGSDATVGVSYSFPACQ